MQIDRSLFYRIDNLKKYEQYIKEETIIESPEGTPADIFILQLAHEKSNMSFFLTFFNPKTYCGYLKL